jgi:hypothetical protein
MHFKKMYYAKLMYDCINVYICICAHVFVVYISVSVSACICMYIAREREGGERENCLLFVVYSSVI